ncbi:Cwf15/Cwc15 cell cycle control protein [Heliocybe sulcata]|uniref:Cwf15/Cwc15 cell cycle control protein n=1 Tax=Heliocybe sulcata TaxID=5364 RepID=A0A5C3ML56_9AGAM|nr:Cwf15/Cwc15 cell cycle control protein [Heliocybe sulcata]
MSTAHRPTWDPAQARDVKGGSRQFSVRDMAAHTKLKFRQPGQTAQAEVAKRDLRMELVAAEAEARNRKRKAEGKPPLEVEGAGEARKAIMQGGEEEEASKRRKILQEALEMDRDDDDDEDGDKDKDKDGDGDVVMDKGEDQEEEEDSDEEEEDDTEELLKELEKIKRERAEEKARQEREESAGREAEREAQIAAGNPLLSHLAAALGQGPDGLSTTAPGTFAVKRRWDDDLIFKNQAVSSREKDARSGQFVNDLLRTEFHKCVFLVCGASFRLAHFPLGGSCPSLSRYVWDLCVCSAFSHDVVLVVRWIGRKCSLYRCTCILSK